MSTPKIQALFEKYDQKDLIKLKYNSIVQLDKLLKSESHYKINHYQKQLCKYVDYCLHFWNGDEKSLRENQSKYYDPVVSFFHIELKYTMDGWWAWYVIVGLIFDIGLYFTGFGKYYYYVPIITLVHLSYGAFKVWGKWKAGKYIVTNE